MKYKNLFNLILVLFALVSKSYSSPQQEISDIQFFGDLYIPYHVMKATGTNHEIPNIFKDITPILDSSLHNVVNFEGVTTGTFFQQTFKLYALKMPLWIAKTLADVGIFYANLANNHSIDFGKQGLFDSLATLNNSQIQTFGAGFNINEASKPLIIPINKHITVCLLGFSRTLPADFWAKENKHGTNNLSYKETSHAIKECKLKNYFTVANFHWGQESISVPKKYQRKLAELSIDSGADLVIGHHPHILQNISIYKNKPIFYSLGNFIFGSNTKNKPQQGASVKIKFNGKKPLYHVIPLNVQNSEVEYFAKPFLLEEKNPLEDFLPVGFCQKRGTNYTYYQCNF